MATKVKNRKLEIFSIHARTKDGAIESYEELFKTISETRPELRNEEQFDKIIGLPVVKIENGFCHIIAVEGPKGESPLIYDSGQSTMHIEKLTARQIVGTKTHAVIQIDSRTAIIEFNHKGAKASDIEYLLGKIARRIPKYQSLEFNLNVKISENLVKEIDRFERIRVAKIKVARPNIDWTDSHDTIVKIAKDSNAHNMNLEATAGRSQSLEKDTGLVGFLKSLTKGFLSTIKGGSVKGVRRGEQVETTVSTANHVEHTKVSVNVSPDGHVDTNDIDAKLMAILVARDPRNKPK